MKIFLPVWGDKHIKLLDECAAMSCRWPKNKAALQGSKWIILTNGEFNDSKLSEIIRSIDKEATIYFDYCPDLMTSNGDKGPLLLNSLIKTIEACLRDKEPLLMMTPDYIYGDGTIGNMKKVAGDKFSVSFAHMRVEKNVLEEITEPWSNAELMGLGMTYPHDTWTRSKLSEERGITFWGGISWDEIEPKLYAVTHFLPAPFLVNFIADDLTFFKAKHEFPHDKLTFALWDHFFPSKLIQEGRLKYIGSSDIACMIEVTEAEANIPPNNPDGVKNIDGYVKHTLHNHIHKQFVATFRGE
jgi:hypothetical protein